MGLPGVGGKEEQRQEVSSGIATRAGRERPRLLSAERGLWVLDAQGLDAPGLRRGKSAPTGRETIYASGS